MDAMDRLSEFCKSRDYSLAQIEKFQGQIADLKAEVKKHRQIIGDCEAEIFGELGEWRKGQGNLFKSSHASGVAIVPQDAATADESDVPPSDLQDAGESVDETNNSLNADDSGVPDEKPLDDGRGGAAQVDTTARTPSVGFAGSDDESWRDQNLCDLFDPEIPPRVVQALLEHNPPIATMGQLADWQKQRADFWATDIKGVGPAGREKIENAVMAYWERNGDLASATK